MNEFAACTRYNEAQGSEESFLNPTHKIESPGFNFERRCKGAPELPRPRSSAKLNPPDSILRGGARERAQFSASAFGLCRKRRRADFAPTTWLGWQDSNLQYQSQSLVCYRYTTSHHRSSAQRGRFPGLSFAWGGRWGSNPRHPEPQSGAHTN